MSWKEEVIALIEKHFGGPHREETKEEWQGIAKAVDVEKRHFTAVVLRPNEVDLHGDIYDEEVVEKACHDYNELCRQGNIQHLIQTELATPIESYVAKSDFALGTGEVKAGDWVLTMKIKDDELWEMCKSGDFTGFSVGCMGTVEAIDE